MQIHAHTADLRHVCSHWCLSLPDPVDSSKSVFPQQSDIMSVMAGFYHSMQIAPKDTFGNSALIQWELLTAEIRKVQIIQSYSVIRPDQSNVLVHRLSLW